jgi:hypothetical protein
LGLRAIMDQYHEATMCARIVRKSSRMITDRPDETRTGPRPGRTLELRRSLSCPTAEGWAA